MWFLIVTILLAFTFLSESTKHSHLALEQIHHQIAQVHGRANRYHLETEVNDASPMELHDRIVERNSTFWTELEERYGSMDVSEGVETQNALLELWEEEGESGFSDEVREKTVEGFGELDGSEDLMEKIVALNGSEMTGELKKRLLGFGHIDKTMEKQLNHVQLLSDLMVSDLEEITTQFPSLLNLSPREKYDFFDQVVRLQREIKYFTKDIIEVIQALKDAGFLHSQDSRHLLKPLIEVTDDVISKAVKIKQWEKLSPILKQVSEEMRRLERLKDSSEGIKTLLETVKKDSGQLKNYKISARIFKKYEDVPSLHPFLQKIRSLSSYMNRLELKVIYLSESWKALEEHFRDLNFPDELSAEKFDGLMGCLTGFNFTTEISREELDKFDNSLKPLSSLEKEFNETLEPLYKLQNHPQFDALKNYSSPDDLDEKIYGILEVLRLDFKMVTDRLDLSKTRHGYFMGFTNNGLDTVRKLDFDLPQKIFDQLKDVEKLLVCYDELGVSGSDVKQLLDSTKDHWNFDPQVLESTVDVIGVIKNALKRMKEVSEWKPVEFSSHRRFVLAEEGVQKITVVLNGLESIRKVRKMWKNLEKLKIQNPDWEVFRSSLATFFEDLSLLDSSFDFFANIQFPGNLPIDAIRKFIEEDYTGSHRSYILKFLDEVQLFQVQYPTADMIQNLNEAMKEMKAWEEQMSPSVEETPTFVDCSEETCDVILKFPGVGLNAAGG